MKQQVDVMAYAANILEALPKGILLTTSYGQRVNTMTIGWGTLGIEWGLPVFITYVRSSRLTYDFLLKNPQFTINTPVGSFDRRILAIAGTKSGREIDKISALDLHLETPEKISVPGIRELPLTLECSVIYAQAQEPAAIPQILRERFYPEDATDLSKPLNNVYHTAFYGQIVASYIVS